jgi:hypothetical protein
VHFYDAYGHCVTVEQTTRLSGYAGSHSLTYFKRDHHGHWVAHNVFNGHPARAHAAAQPCPPSWRRRDETWYATPTARPSS